jgi:hypothetical protein
MRFGEFLLDSRVVFPDLDRILLQYSQLAVVPAPYLIILDSIIVKSSLTGGTATASHVRRGQVPFEKMLIRDEV